MAVNNSLALLVRPPEIDVAGTMMAANQIQSAQTNNELAQMKLRQANRQQGALDAYRASGNLQDLRGEPDIYSKYSEMADADQQRKLLANARDAQSLLAMPESQRTQAWPSMLEKARQEGRIDDGTYQRLSQTGPNDLVLQNVISMASKIPTQLESAQREKYLAEAEKDRAQTAQLKTPSTSPFKTTKDQLEYEQGLRREYTGQAAVKDFGTVRDAYGKIQGAANGTAAGDLSLIFAYMKMLDPASTVREGEFANAQNATGVPGQITNLYNQVMQGTRLNNDQRKDFIDHAKRIYGVHERQYNAVRGQFSNLARRVQIDPSVVTLDYGAYGEGEGDPYGSGPARPQARSAAPEVERFNAPPRPTQPGRTDQPAGPLPPDQHAAAIQEANEAIRAGKDRAAVMKRLRDLGVEFEETSPSRGGIGSM